jgi:quercetin dioxygenase-like cupin family protein
MKIISLKEAWKTAVNMEGARYAYKQVPISKLDGSPVFSFRVFTLEPDGYTPYHAHPFEHLNYIISGEGALVTAAGEELAVRQGDFVIVLPDEKHQYRNKSAEVPLVFICAVPKEYE